MLEIKTVDGMWPRGKLQTAMVNTKAAKASKASYYN